MADQRWYDISVVFTKILCGRNFCVWQVTKLKFTGQLQMASLSLYPQFETNLMSNRDAIELLLQLKSAKARGKNYITVKAHLVRHLLRNRQFTSKRFQTCCHYFTLICHLDLSIRYFVASMRQTTLSQYGAPGRVLLAGPISHTGK